MRCIKSPGVALLAVAITLTAAPRARALQPDRAARIAWLEKNAAPIASTDPANTDYADLAALGKAIGGARVVMLGEESHGDGTTFLAKTRIIRYLHEQLGFDVLAFESGLYDVPVAWKILREGQTAAGAVPQGVFGIWTGSREFQPLIDYIGVCSKTSRPLEITGFDSQFTASASREYFRIELRGFLNAHNVDTTKIANWNPAMAVLDSITEHRYSTVRPSAGDQKMFLAAWDDMTRRVESLPRTARDSDLAYWKQLVHSTRAYAEQTFAGPPDREHPNAAFNNVRDVQMGNNLVWLARERFPAHKIIVWAASFHIMHNPTTIDAHTATSMYAGLVTMGHVVTKALGKDAYAIGFIASEGTVGAWMSPLYPLPPRDSTSLEGLLAATKLQNAFLDLRRIPDSGQWLRSQMVSSPLGYANHTADWTNIFDGMIYTRVMVPSSHAQR